jgi:cytochrome c-type biogenesis protein CcmH
VTASNRIARLVLIALLAVAPAAFAIDPIEFSGPEEERRYKELVEELRCLMCQNQNLADSDSLIAKDLRREVFEQMRAGKSDAEIKDFLVQRYGDFVLYRPPVKPNTWLLWFGPAVVLLLGGVALARVVRARAQGLPADARGEEDLP